MIETTVIVKTERCASCAVVFGLSADFMKERRESGATFYCPNGHSLTYGPSEISKLRAALERAQRAAIDARDEAANHLIVARNARTAQKRETTRRRNVETRIANGVCPHCHRHFVNVERHMKSKHIPR